MYRHFSTRLRNPILWLMVPMVLLVSRPSAGCVCADGTVLPVCCKSDPVLSRLCNKSPKQCCASASVCPHCKPDAASQGPAGSCELKTGSCGCHSLPNHVDAAKSSDFDPQSQQLSMAVSTVLPVAVIEPAGFRQSAAARQCQPAIDRVVVFLHLTI
jgi:hypothetical protein